MNTNKTPYKDDPDAPLTALIGAIGVFVVFLAVIGMQALFYHVQKVQTEQKNYGYAFDELHTLQSQQQQQIYSYHWINQAKGIAAIPIDRAMELETADLRQQAATQSNSSEPAP